MPKGISLHIGLNHISPQHYGNLAPLKAAVNDAVFWKNYAEQHGYRTLSLHDEESTVQAVKKTIAQIAEQMQAGDILLLTYAGHGGQVFNQKPQGLDREQYDQTWCLYDRQLLDNELYEAFEAFPEGSRILVVSDSCHSGTVTRAEEINLSQLLEDGNARAADLRGSRSRKLPRGTIPRNLLQDTYDDIVKLYKNKRKGALVKSAVKLLAACQDNQQTYDGDENGIFTAALAKILADPAQTDSNCESLIEAIKMSYAFPTPNFFQYGAIIESFDKGSPFKIDIDNATLIVGNREPHLVPPLQSIGDQNANWDDSFEVKTAAQISLKIENPNADTIVEGESGDLKILNRNRSGNIDHLLLEVPKLPFQQAWSAAHALQTALAERGYAAEAEPVQSLNATGRTRPVAAREGDKSNPDYIPDWPPVGVAADKNPFIGWHLDERHTQFADAQAAILKKADAQLKIKIAHLDTGYLIDHPALPQHLNTMEAKSFVQSENPNQAIDPKNSGQDGHGMGTLGILAGGQVTQQHTFNEFEGLIGANPFAEVLPLRISDSVVIWNSDNFCAAVRYAIERGCEVITMSMAGKPNRDMARAVNEAYEAGIVIVSAAGNCWYKGMGALLPKCVMYPAAFERVIAATGALFTDEPYDKDFMLSARMNITTKYMQGSWGPASRMSRALAAYTPNIPWASSEFTFLRSGGGTSSATPQIAAAAALWIGYHQKDLRERGFYEKGNEWKKVEAVRYALYNSAVKEKSFAEWKKYYGNGILRSFDALQIGVPDDSKLQKAPPAESSFGGFLETVGSFFKNRPLFRSETPKPTADSLALELLHLVQTEPRFAEIFSELDLSASDPAAELLKSDDFRWQVQQSPFASDFLKEAFV